VYFYANNIKSGFRVSVNAKSQAFPMDMQDSELSEVLKAKQKR
jgi:hypothetical protein